MFRLFLLIVPLFFAGCYSKCGVTSEYYCECKEYYDIEGVYHKDCPSGIFDFGAKKK
ncbi:MAG TPA: hypothetical protein PLV58_03440 [Campylobacterales bacterium]|nr:hypothetical protein [Campylobacterales bacterium]